MFGFGSVRQNVARVINVGNSPETACDTRDGPGRRRRLNHNSIGSAACQKTEEQGNVKGHVLRIATHGASRIPQNREAFDQDSFVSYRTAKGTKTRGQDGDVVPIHRQRMRKPAQTKGGRRRLGGEDPGGKNDATHLTRPAQFDSTSATRSAAWPSPYGWASASAGSAG